MKFQLIKEKQKAFMQRNALLAFTIPLILGFLWAKVGWTAANYLDVVLTPASLDAVQTQQRAYIASVSGAEHLQQPLVVAVDGEIRPSSEWLWAAMPHHSFNRALRLGAAPAGIALVDLPGELSVRAQLTALHLHTVTDTQATIRGEILLTLTTKEGAVLHRHITAEKPVSATLPGTLPATAGELYQELAEQIWTIVAGI